MESNPLLAAVSSFGVRLGAENEAVVIVRDGTDLFIWFDELIVKPLMVAFTATDPYRTHTKKNHCSRS
jgi:hypothetical protein